MAQSIKKPITNNNQDGKFIKKQANKSPPKEKNTHALHTGDLVCDEWCGQPRPTDEANGTAAAGDHRVMSV